MSSSTPRQAACVQCMATSSPYACHEVRSVMPTPVEAGVHPQARIAVPVSPPLRHKRPPALTLPLVAVVAAKPSQGSHVQRGLAPAGETWSCGECQGLHGAGTGQRHADTGQWASVGRGHRQLFAAGRSGKTNLYGFFSQQSSTVGFVTEWLSGLASKAPPSCWAC